MRTANDEIQPDAGTNGKSPGFFRLAWLMYRDGFREMTIGRILWLIILIKLFVFFVFMKLLFFPDILSRDFDTDEQRADHVRKELIQRN